MSLGQVVSDVCDLVGLPRPNGVVGNASDQLARQMLALANSSLEALATMNWPILVIDYSFLTVVAQAQYDLPADWSRTVTNTVFVASQYYEMRGSQDAMTWERVKNTLPSPAGRMRYRIYGNPLKINVTPVPQTVETVAIEYITKNVIDGGKPMYTDDADVPLFPEELVKLALKWRIKHAKGLDYAEDFNEYELRKEALFSMALNLGSIPVAYRNYAQIPELGDGYIPESGYGQ